MDNTDLFILLFLSTFNLLPWDRIQNLLFITNTMRGKDGDWRYEDLKT